ncbi:Dyp-type peroxidase [Leptothrix sp. BB-4]
MNAWPPVELDDVQGLLRRGYGQHAESAYLLLTVRDPAAARRWLGRAPVATARRDGELPERVLQVALTAPGLRALGLADDVLAGFSAEFLLGLGQDESQARRLGDIGPNAPSGWAWGHGERTPHVLLVLLARPGRLAGWAEELQVDSAGAFDTVATLSGTARDGREPFGFADGLSQPEPDWDRRRPVSDAERPAYDNVGCLGEFLLGYPNEYGGYTARPLLDAARDPRGLLPEAEDEPGRRDLGRNGSYLVLRQLAQDVAGFWSCMTRMAESLGDHDGDAAGRLAERLVGRRRDGQPLVERHGPGAEDFDFSADPDGLRCPLGAHIRRSNPRNGDLPPGDHTGLTWLLRTLGLDAAARERDRVASTRFHRLLRRGRAYGPADAPQGLAFVALNASLSRQFEFVQAAWIASTHFDGLSGEADPLLGHRLPDEAGRPSDAMTLPQPGAAPQRLQGLPRFVTVRGGAYFFLPGVRALRWIAAQGEPGQQGLTS